MSATLAATPRILVLGGARSGKSRHAEALADGAAGDRIYIATAEARDDEMAERIAAHRNRRGGGWRTVEAPLDLPAAIRANAADHDIVLVDCLTLWLTNIMLADRDVAAESANLLDALAEPRRIVLVANEVGLGIVPDNALARRFRDAAGILNREVAARADAVIFVAAGLPLVMKSDPVRM